MRVVTALIIGFIGVLFNFFLAPKLSVKGVSPQMATAFVLFASFYAGRRVGLWAGFIAGFILDFYSRHLIGSGMIIFSVMGFAAGYMTMEMYVEKITTRLLFLFLFNFIYSNFIWLTTRGGGTAILKPFFSIILPGVIYSTFIGAIILFALFYLFTNTAFFSSLLKKVE